MSVAKADRFCFNGIFIPLKQKQFQDIVFKNIWMSDLGESNYKDLYPEQIEDGSQITQRVYSDINGNLYEVCLILKEEELPVICGVRTRQQK